MTMEEDVTYVAGSGTMVDETRYLLGARGIERLEAQRMASPLPNDPLKTAKRSYPLYDGHGNMIATLGRTATGYTIANEKKYDVWGAVRASQSPGSHVVNPNKEYCANLGHTFDGESDLIYMRARYYEPSTGRFISEDPAGDGLNWYVYAANNPVFFVDSTGKFIWTAIGLLSFLIGTAISYYLKANETTLKVAILYRVAWLLISTAMVARGIIEWKIKLSDTEGQLKDVYRQREELDVEMRKALSYIDDIKMENGRWLEKIAVAQLEQLLYLVWGDLD